MVINFIKVFENEKEATQFAEIRKTKVIIHYDWDSVREKIIKQFVVRY